MADLVVDADRWVMLRGHPINSDGFADLVVTVPMMFYLLFSLPAL